MRDDPTVSDETKRSTQEAVEVPGEAFAPQMEALLCLRFASQQHPTKKNDVQGDSWTNQ